MTSTGFLAKFWQSTSPEMDFEKPFPLEGHSFTTVICFNVLEHVYDYKQALSEMKRILIEGGTLYFYVPYLIKIHGSPLDFFRYTHFALERMFKEVGFSSIEIYYDGGVFKNLCEIFNGLHKILIGYLLYPFFICLYI